MMEDRRCHTIRWKLLVGMFFLFLSASVASGWSIHSIASKYTDARVRPLENEIENVINKLRDINAIVVDNNADIRELLTMLHERNSR